MRRTWMVGSVAALVALAAFAFFFGRPLAQSVGIFLAEDGFRDQHNTQGYPAAVLSSFDWALAFGGEAGIPALEKLAGDASITEAGRQEAARIKHMIESGRFEEELRWCERNDIPLGAYHYWLLRRP